MNAPEATDYGCLISGAFETRRAHGTIDRRPADAVPLCSFRHTPAADSLGDCTGLGFFNIRPAGRDIGFAAPPMSPHRFVDALDLLRQLVGYARLHAAAAARQLFKHGCEFRTSHEVPYHRLDAAKDVGHDVLFLHWRASLACMSAEVGVGIPATDGSARRICRSINRAGSIFARRRPARASFQQSKASLRTRVCTHSRTRRPRTVFSTSRLLVSWAKNSSSKAGSLLGKCWKPGPGCSSLRRWVSSALAAMSPTRKGLKPFLRRLRSRRLRASSSSTSVMPSRLSTPLATNSHGRFAA